MKGLRQLNNGKWNKPPVLSVARRIFISDLATQFDQCSLGDVATFLNGTSYDTNQVSEFGKVPIIRISNITNPRSPYLRTSEQLDDKYWVRPGDLLVSWSASFKSIIWPGPEGYLNQHIFNVTERKGYDRRYIRHAIEASFDQMQEQVVGIGMMHLRRADFLGYHIPTPSIDVQEATANYLDYLEAGGKGTRPELPKALELQQRVVTRIQDLAAQIQEAQMLRDMAAEQVETLVISNHLRLAGGRKRRLGEILQLDEDAVKIRPDGSYPQVGVRSFGEGLFPKSSISGTETTYRTFNRLFDGAMVLSQVKGWEGAVAVCPKSLAGWFVSPEYRTFRCIEGESSPYYLAPLVRTKWFWSRLVSATRGVGARRERTRPEQFLDIEIPMPDLPCQRIGERVIEQIGALKPLQAETATELDALLQSVLSKAFEGKL